MEADDIRNTFGWNSVHGMGRSGHLETDTQELLRYQIMALGELAAQLAEDRTDRNRVKGTGGPG